MRKEEYMIRDARPEDAAGLADIYRPYVTDTAITFEYEAPDPEEFRKRIKDVMKIYPYLVAESADGLLGYAYLTAFHPRTAYSWCAECAIYLSGAARGRGIGRALYEKLEFIAKKMNITNLYACIGVPDQDDEYLDHNSMHFHEHMGFRMIGQFDNCGYKFHRWYHMVWMEKIIGCHKENMPDRIPYPVIAR